MSFAPNKAKERILKLKASGLDNYTVANLCGVTPGAVNGVVYRARVKEAMSVMRGAKRAEQASIAPPKEVTRKETKSEKFLNLIAEGKSITEAMLGAGVGYAYVPAVLSRARKMADQRIAALTPARPYGRASSHKDDILNSLCEGYSPKQVAAKFFITDSTVYNIKARAKKDGDPRFFDQRLKIAGEKKKLELAIQELNKKLKELS